MVREAAEQCLRCLAAHGDAEALAYIEGLRGAVRVPSEFGLGKQLAEDPLRRRAARPRWLKDHRHEGNAVTGALHGRVTE